MLSYVKRLLAGHTHTKVSRSGSRIHTVHRRFQICLRRHTHPDTDYPVAYVSGLFRGSQLNWAALTKEAYAIYMSVKKLSFYLDSAKITVRSDHLPLKRFLEKNTMNSKVNNWAVELESQKIDFKFIPGVQNVLADTLSRLIEIDGDIQLPKEAEGQEFGYVPFEQLPPVQAETLEEILINEISKGKLSLQFDTPVMENIEIQLPLTDQKMKELQEQDPKVSHLRKLWSQNKLNKNLFTMERDILRRQFVINGLLYKPVITPAILKDCLLMLAHDKQGHNGFKRTYSALQKTYYWKGMKRHIQLHCRMCRTCVRHNMRTQEFHEEHFSVPSQPMEFIAMDLIGEFHPASSKGNRYTLTAVCMLTGFTFCIPLKNKSAEEVVKAYLNHIYCVFGPSRKIFTDNGSEFKNKMWEEVYRLNRSEHRVTPIYSPQCNSRIKGFHKFVKATISKQMQKGLEWDDLVYKATSAHNFFPTESSGSAPFFLMFGCEPAAKHMLLAEESTKYVGDNQGIMNIKLMQQLYHVVAYNLAKLRTARRGNDRLQRKSFRPRQLKEGGLVLVKNHTAKAFEPKGIDHHIVSFEGRNRVLVKDNHGKITKVHRKDVQPIEMDIAMAEFIKSERAKLKVRDAQHVMPLKQTPDLNLKFDENIDQVDSENPVHQALERPEHQEPIFVQFEEVIQMYLPVSQDPTEVADMKEQESKTEEPKQVEENEVTSNTPTATVETAEDIVEITEVSENPPAEITSNPTDIVEAVGDEIKATEVNEAVDNETEIAEINEVTDTPTESEDTNAGTVNTQVQKAKSNHLVKNSFVTKFFAVLKPVANAMSRPITRNTHF